MITYRLHQRCSTICTHDWEVYTHRRTGQHPFGGADRVLPEWIRWGGGSSRKFPGSIFSGVGGGVVAEIFRFGGGGLWQNCFR